MSTHYTTSEELDKEVFSSDQNVVNIDDLPKEEKEFIISRILKYSNKVYINNLKKDILNNYVR